MASGLQGFRASGLQGDGRDIVLDSLRGFAIILVVVGHVIRGFNHSKLIFPGSALIDGWIYSFHMPLMFMVSGYVDGMRQKTSGILQRIKKCIVSIYLPCLYFSLILWLPKFLWSFLGISNAENFTLASVNDLFRIPFYGFDIYWFLATLFFVKLLHILTERFIPGRSLRALFWLSAFMLYLSCAGIPSFCYYGLYFFTGFTLRRENIITSGKHPGIICGIILFLAGMIFFSASYFGGLANFFTRDGAAVCSSLGLLIMFYALDIRGAFLALCGANSMVIYVFHGWVISSLRLVFRRLGLSETVNPAVLFVFFCVMAVLLPLCVIRLYRNVKRLGWIEYIFYPGKLIFRK